MSGPPCVSVLVAAYRRPAYLAEAIESVLDQTFTDFELIVLEDGSHDAEPIVRRYGDRVRYQWQPNQGQAGARNSAARLARGEWLAFLDDDDRWMPEKLARQVALVRHFPGLGLVHTNFLDLHGGVARPRRGRLSGAEMPSGWITAPLILGYFGLPSTVMVRRALFERAGGFNRAYRVSEDYDLLLRLSRLSPFGYLAEPLVTHRLHADSQSHDELALTEDTLVVLEQFLAWSPCVREDCGPRAVARRLADLHLRRGRLLYWGDDFSAARRHLAAAWRLEPARLSSLGFLAAAALPAPVIRALRILKAGLAPRSLGEPRRTDA
jgi:glycosyltransferase involved in cell wall biosynthesis